MEIEFAPEKDSENIRRRGIPLAFGAVVLANRIGEVEDGRQDYGETRTRAFGEVDGLLFACTYTMRGAVARIISVHRVREKEMRKWLSAR